MTLASLACLLVGFDIWVLVAGFRPPMWLVATPIVMAAMLTIVVVLSARSFTSAERRALDENRRIRLEPLPPPDEPETLRLAVRTPSSAPELVLLLLWFGASALVVLLLLRDRPGGWPAILLVVVVFDLVVIGRIIDVSRRVRRRPEPDLNVIVVDDGAISLPSPILEATPLPRHSEAVVRVAWDDIDEWRVREDDDGPDLYEISVRRERRTPPIRVLRSAVVDESALLDAVRSIGQRAVTLEADVEPAADK